MINWKSLIAVIAIDMRPFPGVQTSTGSPRCGVEKPDEAACVSEGSLVVIANEFNPAPEGFFSQWRKREASCFFGIKLMPSHHWRQ